MLVRWCCLLVIFALNVMQIILFDTVWQDWTAALAEPCSESHFSHFIRPRICNCKLLFSLYFRIHIKINALKYEWIECCHLKPICYATRQPCWECLSQWPHSETKQLDGWQAVIDACFLFMSCQLYSAMKSMIWRTACLKKL